MDVYGGSVFFSFTRNFPSVFPYFPLHLPPERGHLVTSPRAPPKALQSRCWAHPMHRPNQRPAGTPLLWNAMNMWIHICTVSNILHLSLYFSLFLSMLHIYIYRYLWWLYLWCPYDYTCQICFKKIRERLGRQSVRWHNQQKLNIWTWSFWDAKPTEPTTGINTINFLW